jgi:hypothetical protein
MGGKADVAGIAVKKPLLMLPPFLGKVQGRDGRFTAAGLTADWNRVEHEARLVPSK